MSQPAGMPTLLSHTFPSPTLLSKSLLIAKTQILRTIEKSTRLAGIQYLFAQQPFLQYQFFILIL
jgi:hypothetical protein